MITYQDIDDGIKAGDAGALLAKVENFIAQTLAAKDAEHASALSAQQAASADTAQSFAGYQVKAMQVASAIEAAVKDPNIDSDAAVLSILSEATKGDLQKQKDALQSEIVEKQAALAALG